MELWVRSQDKTKLIKVDNVFIEEYVCGGANVETNNCVLGTYKTKERALEVLDEIQELLVKSNPNESFIIAKNIDFDDYGELKWYIERSRKDNFFAYNSGTNNNSSVEILQPNVLVYEMPKE